MCVNLHYCSGVDAPGICLWEICSTALPRVFLFCIIIHYLQMKTYEDTALVSPAEKLIELLRSFSPANGLSRDTPIIDKHIRKWGLMVNVKINLTQLKHLELLLLVFFFLSIC